ncbi:MAG: ATP-binding protein [Nanoarchaeota archaeon]|nr:ATP-binding protein [Nanoarchaeota archaeon]
MIGKIVGGSVGEKVIIRIKSGERVDVGDILIAEDKETKEKFFLKVVNINISSLIARQFIEEMAGQNLESGEDFEIFDSQERFYRLCEAKVLKIKRDGKFYPPRTIPNFFTDVRKIEKEDLDFIKQEGEIPIGHLRLGTKKVSEIKINLPANKLISHHMLVVAATGKGKSNFAKVFLSGLLELGEYSAVVFDPHNEYYGGKGTKGLKHHHLNNRILYISPKAREIPGAEELKIHVEDLEPDDFFGIADLSQAQQEALSLLKKKYNENWIKHLLEEKIEKLIEEFDKKVSGVTFATLRRKMQHVLELDESGRGLVFTIEKREDTSIYNIIKQGIKQRKIIIIDTSSVGEEAEKIIASSILNKLFTSYRYAKQKDEVEFNNLPEVLVVFEEAPRVLGKEVLAKGVNVFEKIAREGRKFKIGLCAITQMPSLIPAEILSQMNTKVILGLPAPADRKAVINSSAQNISDEDVEIQILDMGEALVTSPFVKFPLPVKIFKFEEQIKRLQKDVPDIAIG